MGPSRRARPFVVSAACRLAYPDGMPETEKNLRVAVVAGVNPGKWTRAWSERRRDLRIEVIPIDETDQVAVIAQRRADLVFARLPIVGADLSIIRLYQETPVVVASRDHPIALVDSVDLADLVGETVRDEPLADAIDLVVAGAGIMLLPQSVARQASRRDLVVRPVADAPVTEIALVWNRDETTPDIEEFVGIVRGRTAASSRGPSRSAAPPARRRGR